MAGGRAATTVDLSGGGMFRDQAGGVLFDNAGSAAVTISAAAGADTVLGGNGPVFISAPHDTYSLLVAGGGGPLAVTLLHATAGVTPTGGAAGETVTGGSGPGLLDLIQSSPLALHPGAGEILLTASGDPIELWAADNSGYAWIDPAAGSPLDITFDGLRDYTIVSGGGAPTAVIRVESIPV